MKKWDVYEVACKGKTEGNPFTDYEIYGEFVSAGEQKKVTGFYDGDGVYRVRFMPSTVGTYTYKVYGSFSEEIYEDAFEVEDAASHGKICVDGMGFRYEDGTPYYSVGTTCYAWVGQPLETQKQTLESLKNSAFNKMRFCIFPKHYDYNYRDPIMFPYEGTPVDDSQIGKFTYNDYKPDHPDNHWDFARFNTDYFKMIDEDVRALMELGIEADIILFHPYDRWGFSIMPDWANDLYLKYMAARYSAFRNVWWSLANEFDLCHSKSEENWDHYGELVIAEDPYHHLISAHNCNHMFDFSKPWVTHCSIQRMTGEYELDNIPKFREKFQKPIVIDEMCYEGNIEQEWGDISGQEMLRKMWKVVVLGGHPGHGECYLRDTIWWSHGGRLYGESYKRLELLHEIMETSGELHPVDYLKSENADGSVKLHYYGEHRPCYRVFELGEEAYKIEIIDTWNMTIEDYGIHTGRVQVPLPVREYMAIRLIRQ